VRLVGLGGALVGVRGPVEPPRDLTVRDELGEAGPLDGLVVDGPEVTRDRRPLDAPVLRPGVVPGESVTEGGQREVR
jgi:hypothetical protein